MDSVDTKLFPAEALHEFCTRVFIYFGLSKSDAVQAADVIVAADLRGIDSHGVARMDSYGSMVKALLLSPLNPAHKQIKMALPR